MSASIPSISVYPNVGLVKYMYFGQSSSAKCSASFTGTNVNLTANATCQATTDSSGIEKIIKCTATFQTSTDLTGGTYNFTVTCSGKTIFQASFNCSGVTISAGPFSVEVVETSS